MKGEISVESNVGVSTSFYVELVLPPADEVMVDKEGFNLPILPVIQKPISLKSHASQQVINKPQTETSHSNPADEQNKTNKSRKHCKILVADDSKINRMVLAGYLEDENCTVTEAKDGKQAWDLFQKEVFDFVFLDIQMPFLDGIEVSKKIQQSVKQNSSHAKQLKGVFAITAGGDESSFIPQGESLASIGFDGWFVKPVSQAQIVGLLQEGHSSRTPKILSLQSMASKSEFSKQSAGVQLDVENGWDTFDKVPIQFQALMDSFLSEMQGGLAEMVSLNKANNGFSLAAKAHYLKGNCMLLQLENMVDLLRAVEDIVENEKFTQVKQQKIDQVLEKLEFSLKYLEKSLTISHNDSK